MQVRLVTLPRRELVDAFGAEATMPAASGAVDAVVTAFDDALGSVLRDIVSWTARTLHRLETAEGTRKGRRAGG